MKISLAITALLVALFALAGWSNQSRLAGAREARARLEEDATRMGLSANPAERASTRASTRERADRGADPRSTAADLISLFKETEHLGEPDAATWRRIEDLVDRVASLDAAQIRIMVTELGKQTELESGQIQGLIAFPVMVLASEHPASALEFLVASHDLLKEESTVRQLVTSAIGKWALTDPARAMEWLRRNESKFPGMIDAAAKEALLSGAAASDPKLALGWIKELGFPPPQASTVIQEAKNPPQMTAALAAVREYVAGLPAADGPDEILSNAVAELGSAAAKAGFSAGSTWILATNPTPAELECYANALSDQVKGSETGQWIQWLDKNMPEGKSAEPIRDMVRHWTNNDYKAAAKWLDTAPEGPARTAAIRTYAETVAPYEPESAAQWALVLPPGKIRDDTLKAIHLQWPKSDPEGAAAFAKTHGIK